MELVTLNHQGGYIRGFRSHVRSVAAFICALIAVAVGHTPAIAQTRCQCTYDKWVGDCKARIEMKGNWIRIVSNTQQCSRVDWYADENPKVTIVEDGAEMTEWLGPSKEPKLVVQSCKVCTDANYAGESGEGLQRATPGANTPPGRAAPSALSNEGLAGTWRGTLSGLNAGSLVVRLAITGTSLSGTMEMGGKVFDIVSGDVSGDKISWSQSFLFGNVKWSGALNRQARTIRGTWSHPFNSDQFELKKE
jgi:hypothetical protein